MDHLAAIDIGTNSFRMLVAGAGHRSLLQAPVRQTVTVRLGEGLSRTGILSNAAMARGLKALAGFRRVLDQYQPIRTRAIGTHVLRAAANRDEFLEKARDILGFSVEVASEEEEARHAFLGATATLSVSCGHVVIDVGGGSTEITWQDEEELRSLSLPLGAVSVSEQGERLGEEKGLSRVQEAVRRELSSLLPDHLRSGAHPVACGGTATSLAALDLGLAHYLPEKVHGHLLTLERLRSLDRELGQLAPEERERLPLMGQGRGEIVRGGVAILVSILGHLNSSTLTVSDCGLLEGVFLDLAASS